MYRGRKTHRKSHRKGRKARKSHRKGRKSHRKTQRGGGSCAAMPMNRTAFQRGGMAPYSTGDSTLLDKASMIQAESWQQTADIAAAQGLARAQRGGRRRQRGGNYPWSVGLQSFAKGDMLLPAGTNIGANPQFATEGTVNSLYAESRGPQF
jgi:hypothetical protein